MLKDTPKPKLKLIEKKCTQYRFDPATDLLLLQHQSTIGIGISHRYSRVYRKHDNDQNGIGETKLTIATHTYTGTFDIWGRMGNNNWGMPNVLYIFAAQYNLPEHNGVSLLSSLTCHHPLHPHLIIFHPATFISSFIHRFFPPRPAASVVISAGRLLLGERLQVVVERRVDVLHGKKRGSF